MPEKVKQIWNQNYNPDKWNIQTPEIIETDNDQSNICLLTLIGKECYKCLL